MPDESETSQMASTATAETFTLDRTALRQHLVDDYGEPVGLATLSAHGIADAHAIACAVDAAREANAISGVAGVDVIAYELDDAVLVAVREARGLPALRQLASLSVETKYLTAGDDDSFDALAQTVAALLSGHADPLVPRLRLLQAAEAAQRSSPTTRASSSRR